MALQYTQNSLSLGCLYFGWGVRSRSFHVHNMPNKLGILLLYVLINSIYLILLAILHIISIIIYLTMPVYKKWKTETQYVPQLTAELQIQILTPPTN